MTLAGDFVKPSVHAGGFDILPRGYTPRMNNFEILGQEHHRNPGGRKFVLAVVDDPQDGEVKLIVMFEDEGYCAALSLDSLLVEDISQRAHPQSKSYEERLRKLLEES